MTWIRTLLSISLLVGCESVANLDEVNMASGGQAGVAGDAGSELDGDIEASTGGQDSGQADSPTSDALEDALGPLEFPPSCVKYGSVTIGCNPMTNEGCGADTACDMAANGSSYGFVCFPTGTVEEGQPCNGVSGPWCKPTLHCGTAKCVRFCCTSADCPGSACSMYDPIKVGTFGWCN
ncbi:MAG: hypothetical protein HS104_29895 [Polyangiaceae bacterium]|nr:hypothetical protein [Polyangiaceae bacterium]MCL4754649.1 hypothetical protein [Myxococcales bacterium]